MDIETLALNAAYVAYVGASLMPGGLRLRIALVLQSFVFIAWGIVAENPTAILWNIAFAAVNLWQAVRLARRDTVMLTPEEEATHAALFASLSRRDFLVLWSAGTPGSIDAGQQLCEVNDSLDELVLLLDGSVDVVTSAGVEVERGSHTFVGEMSFLSEGTASADVTARTPLRCWSWRFEDLRRLQRLHVDIGRSLEQAISRDVANKLRT